MNCKNSHANGAIRKTKNICLTIKQTLLND